MSAIFVRSSIGSNICRGPRVGARVRAPHSTFRALLVIVPASAFTSIFELFASIFGRVAVGPVVDARPIVVSRGPVVIGDATREREYRRCRDEDS